jgi:hypothetical protein
MGIQGGFLGGRGRDHTERENDGQRSQEDEYHATYDVDAPKYLKRI